MSSRSNYRLGKGQNSLSPYLAYIGLGLVESTCRGLPLGCLSQPFLITRRPGAPSRTSRPGGHIPTWGQAVPDGSRAQAGGGNGTLEASEINCTSLKILSKPVPSSPGGHLFAFVVKNALIYRGLWVYVHFDLQIPAI